MALHIENFFKAGWSEDCRINEFIGVAAAEGTGIRSGVALTHKIMVLVGENAREYRPSRL